MSNKDIIELSTKYQKQLQDLDARTLELIFKDHAKAVEYARKGVKIIDPDFLMEGDEERYLSLRQKLPEQVLGQSHATSEIAETLITAKADLHDPRKPLGIFMLLGPTGVGKTETARALSRLLHGSEENLIRIDMSDYMERHEASKLFGAPPGYVGYGEEGLLTGAVRRQPYSVVVLDEIEKAHPEVLKQFLQIFEEGEKVDAKGQTISFRNTMILMTSNLGAQSAVAEAEAEGLDPQSDQWIQTTEPIYNMAAKSTFAPEFLNRIDSVVVYNPLSKEVIGELVQTEVQSLSERIKQKFGLALNITPDVRSALSQEGYKPEYGARELKRVIKKRLIQPLAGWILERRSDLATNGVIEVSGLNSGFNAEIVPVSSTEEITKV